MMMITSFDFELEAARLKPKASAFSTSGACWSPWLDHGDRVLWGRRVGISELSLSWVL